MKLITKTLEKVFDRFPLYSQDGKPINEKKALCKFFTPWGANTWIVTEASRNAEKPGDWDFFGIVTLGYGWEWGYFSLSELQTIRGRCGLGVERELYSIDPGKMTVYEVLKAEGNVGAEAAEEMLEWERDEETEEPQPEAKQTQPEQEPEEWPDPLPVLPEDWPEIVLENYDYSPEDAQRIYDEGAPENWEEIRPDIWRRTKSNGWAIDDGDLELLAKNFIKGVQDNDARRVCWSVDYLEDCNYHTANRNFFEGKAAEYIQDAPQYRAHMELIGGIPEHNIYWFLDGDRVLVQDENMNLLTARLDLRNGAPNILLTRENLRTIWPYWDNGDGNGPTWRKPSEMLKYFMEDQYTEQAAAAIVEYFSKELNEADKLAETVRKTMEAPDPEQPEKPNLNHIIGQFFYAEQEYTFPRRSVHKDNIKITDVDEEKVHYKIVDEQLNEPKIPLGCGFMSIESFISGLAAGTIYAIKLAAHIIRIVTESAAPLAVLVDE